MSYQEIRDLEEHLQILSSSIASLNVQGLSTIDLETKYAEIKKKMSIMLMVEETQNRVRHLEHKESFKDQIHLE
tara:strand:+ start:1911 stop:2132 length:222 start_codon:yes stop_codon:yes gene_type:complete